VAKISETGRVISQLQKTPGLPKNEPAEIQEFWQKSLFRNRYNIEQGFAQMQKAGYLPIATFIVPELVGQTIILLCKRLKNLF